MKNPSRFAVPLLLVITFAIPIFSGAATAADCGLYDTYNFITGKCVPRDQSSVMPGSITNAQYAPSGSGVNLGIIKGYSTSIINIINTVFVPVLFAVAFLTFLWGVYKYFILGADNDTERATGRDFVFWGIIGFAVILSVWGLVNVVMTTLNFTTGGKVPNYPTL